MSTPYELPAKISAWLEPLPGAAAGPNLEYEPEFQELVKASEGTPETQFAPAEPPRWREVQPMAEALLSRTRDLRVAMIWLRSGLHNRGAGSLADSFALLSGLLRNFWDSGLYPLLDPDDGDSFERLAPLAGLEKVEGIIGDLRQALVHPDRRLGGLRVRDIEIGLNRLPPRSDETPRSEASLRSMFAELHDVAAVVRTELEQVDTTCAQLQAFLSERISGDLRVDLKPLRQVLAAVQSVLPPEAQTDELGQPTAAGLDTEPGSSAAVPVAAPGAARVGGPIATRQDAIRAIEAVCDYLDRQEPTNPAQLLLRRALALMERDFMQLVRELAPDALRDVARIMGVDPDAL